MPLDSKEMLSVYKRLGSWRLVADFYGVSIRTIFRRLREYDLKIEKTYS